MISWRSCFLPLGPRPSPSSACAQQAGQKGSAMNKRKRKMRALSDAEEGRVQAGIAADPDNPEWSAKDFRRAKPFAKALPELAKSRRTRGRQKQPTKVAVSL